MQHFYFTGTEVKVDLDEDWNSKKTQTTDTSTKIFTLGMPDMQSSQLILSHNKLKINLSFAFILIPVWKIIYMQWSTGVTSSSQS